MGAQYSDGQLSSPALLDAGAAIMESSGGNGGIVGLSSSGTLGYVPSPDIKRRSLVWISPDGSQSDAGFGQREFGAVTLSPDGRRAAISLGDRGDTALYLADASGGPLTPLAKPASWATAWSPDGTSIAGAVRLQNTSRIGDAGSISRVAPEAGRSWEPLLVSERGDDVVAQWTPDGHGLLFSHRDAGTGRRSIQLLALDSTPPKVSVVVDSRNDRSVQFPALSPDGRWLAYESNEAGRAEVYVQSYPAPTARVQVSRDGGSRPLWTKRGDTLHFVAGSAIMSSTVTTQPELRFGIPRAIVNDPLLVLPLQSGAVSKPFDVAPDGRILAIKEDDSIRSDHIVVVQNWLTDARARMSEARK